MCNVHVALYMWYTHVDILPVYIVNSPSKFNESDYPIPKQFIRQ